MATVGVVLHEERAEARAAATRLRDHLAAAGHKLVLPVEDAELIGASHAGLDDEAFAGALDLAVCLGGDGTMLRTTALVAPGGVPILGVNLGQLGYLTAVDPEDLHASVDGFLAGNHGIESRMLLDVVVRRAAASSAGDAAAGGAADGDRFTALNEAILERTEPGHTVRLAVTIGDRFFTPYAADGLIVATPTGSTAYAFSARGPIVEPTHRALLLTPVSPHMLFDRTLITEPGQVIRLEVDGHRPSTLSVDGRNEAVLQPGDAIECTASDRTADFVRLGRHDFHQVLKAKFGLSDR